MKPTLLVYEVTRRCNSRCKECNIWKQKPKSDELSRLELSSMLKDPLWKNLKQVILTGGEVSLREDLLNIILNFYLVNCDMKIWVSTNGLLPEPILRTVDTCQSADVNLGVGVSLDGIGANHDIVRGVPGNFEKADRLIRALVEMKASVSVGFTLTEKTAIQHAQVRAYCHGLGIPMITQRCDRASFYGHSKTSEECSVEWERDIVRSLPDTLLKEHWLRRLDGEPQTFPCYALHSFLFLHANGDVSPCLRRYDEVYGNVNKRWASEIWNSPRIREGRRIVKGCNPQCLNDWGLGWSLKTQWFTVVQFKLAQRLHL